MDYLNVGFSLLRGLDKFYEEGDLEVKQLIISSIFPEKLVYEENQYRTNRINEVVSRICLNGNQLDENKKTLNREI